MHPSERWNTPEQDACVEAQNEVTKKREKLFYALEGRRVDITAGNRGDADNWIRHIDAAYLEYSEACDAWADTREALKQSKLSMIERIKNWKK